MDRPQRVAVILLCLFPAVLVLDLSGLAWRGLPVSLPLLAVLATAVVMQRRPSLTAPPWWSVVFLAAYALGCAALRESQVVQGARELGQVGLSLGLGTWLFANSTSRERCIAGQVLAAANALLLLAGVLSGSCGMPLPYSGVRLSLACAATFPFLISQLLAWRGSAGTVPLAFLALAVVTPHPGLLLLGAAGALLVVGWEPARRAWALGCAGVVCVAVVLVFAGSPRWEILEPHRPVTGNLKRVYLECLAAPRAVAAAPFWGHGLGQYKNTIHSFFVRFPDADDNRVVPDTNSGYVVMAVESGLPAVVCFAAWLVWAAWRARRCGREAPELRPVAAALVVCTAAAVFTVTLNRHTALPLGALLGWAAAGAGGGLAAATVGAWVWRGSVLAAGLLAAGGLHLVTLDAGVGAGNAPMPAKPLIVSEAAEAAPRATAVYCLLEAEAPVAPPDGVMAIKPANDAAGNQALVIEKGAGKGQGKAVYAVSGLTPGDYTVWLRALWHDGCSNSIGCVLGGEEIVITDELFNRWHWVPALRRVKLSAASLELRLQNTEDGIMVDQILLTPDPAFVPQGILGVSGPAVQGKPAAP